MIDDPLSRLLDSAMRSHEARHHRRGLPAIVTAVDYTNRLADVFLKGEQVVFDDVPFNPDLGLRVGDQVIVEVQGGRSYFISAKSAPIGEAIPRPHGAVIAELLLLVDTFELDVLNIPDGFRHLRWEILTRSTGAVQGTELDVWFNGDNTTTNYDYIYGLMPSTGWTITNVIGAGVMEMGTCGGANAPADSADCTRLDIFGYSQTVLEKAVISQTQQKRAESSGAIIAGLRAGWFRSKNPITRITSRLGTGDFVAGTIATLYGMG